MCYLADSKVSDVKVTWWLWNKRVGQCTNIGGWSWRNAWAVAVTIMSYGNIVMTVKCKIQLVETIIFTKATVVKTTEPGPICRIKGRAKARPGPMDATPLQENRGLDGVLYKLWPFVSHIAIFVLKRDVKLQLTNWVTEWLTDWPHMWSCRLMFFAVIFLSVFKSTVTLHASGSCSDDTRLGSSSSSAASIISDSTDVDITSDILTPTYSAHAPPIPGFLDTLPAVNYRLVFFIIDSTSADETVYTRDVVMYRYVAFIP